MLKSFTVNNGIPRNLTSLLNVCKMYTNQIMGKSVHSEFI